MTDYLMLYWKKSEVDNILNLENLTFILTYTIEQVLFQHALLYEGLFQALTFTTVFTYNIEFYGQYNLVSDTQSATTAKDVKTLGLETC